MERVISHSKPTLGHAEAEAAAGAVLSGHVACGDRTDRFERAVADAVGAAAAVATSSGTAALYVALRTLDVGADDEVIIPSFVCTALLHAVWAVGAEPVVCDVGPDFNLSPAAARAGLTKRTAAIILPHIFGTPAPVEEYVGLGPPVIEDCAQAIGAEIGGTKCGAFGAVSTFSFYATKMMTTAEGGMFASDQADLVERARDLIEYDKKHDATRRFNLKFNDVAAAIGLVQLSQLGDFIRRRRELAAAYDRELSGLAGITLARPTASVYYRYVVEVDDVDAFISGLRSRGIAAARPVDPPLHRVAGTAACPNAERAWTRTVSLPIYPSLTDADVRQVAAAVHAVAH